LSAIDSCRIVGPAGWQKIPLDDFFALPLSERIRHVLQRTVEFKKGTEIVPPQEALAELRRLKAA
jgi:hypothetical protein